MIFLLEKYIIDDFYFWKSLLLISFLFLEKVMMAVL